MEDDQLFELQKYFANSAKVDINGETVTFDDGNFVAHTRGGILAWRFGLGGWSVMGLDECNETYFGIPQMDVEDAITIISERLAEIKAKLDHDASQGSALENNSLS